MTALKMVLLGIFVQKSKDIYDIMAFEENIRRYEK